MSTNANNFAPTAAQIKLLTETLRVDPSQIPAVRHEASRMISELLVKRNSVPATSKQIARAEGLLGRDLPGANIREKSTQIAFLELLEAFDAAEEQEAINDIASKLVDLVREKYQDPKKVLARSPRSAALPETEKAPM